nr:DUF4287 domain-containing protein [Novosphingobium sp. FKTRR1]
MPIDYAASGNCGSVSLNRSGKGKIVRVRPLDALNLASCGLLKIDVEGIESAVLRGAADKIDRCRPIIYVENVRAANQQNVISRIADHDYCLFWHLPRLFSAANFRGNQQNIWPGASSITMLCLRGGVVEGAQTIDPSNWTSPANLGNRSELSLDLVDKCGRSLDQFTAMSDGKITGPAAYFPSIEKKYGRPISHWKELVLAALPARHMELVAMLKDQHGLGHGHANAIVAHTLAEKHA